MVLPLNINKEEPVGKENDVLMDVNPVTINEPVIVWFPLNEFEPVVNAEAVNVLNDDVVTNEPVFIVVEELTNPNAVICADELTKFEGNGWTLPLNVYLVSNEDVNWDEPLIVPAGVELTLPLNVYLVSYDDVNWDEPLIKVGLFTIVLKFVEPVILPDTDKEPVIDMFALSVVITSL